MRCGLFRLARAREGAVAIEFAIIVPVLLALMFGGYTATQAVSVSRKLTITTRALADLSTQVTTLSSSDMATVMNAATQIIAPFDATVLGMRLSEITTDAKGNATVTWSVGRNMAAYNKGDPFNLPTGLQASTSYVYSETQYVFTPTVSFGMSGFTLNDRIYMLPRLSSTVSYTG